MANGILHSARGLGPRRLLAWGLATGFLLTLIFLTMENLSWVNLPAPAYVDYNPFTSWGTDRNCVVHFAKAFAWLNSLVAAAIPILHALALFWPAPASASCVGIESRLLPGWLLRNGWTWHNLALLAAVVAANALAFGITLDSALHQEGNNPPYWVSSLPESARGMSESDRVAYVIGDIAAWPTMINFLISGLTVGRTNIFLDMIGVTNYDAVWVHILTSRLAVVWLTVHGFLTSFPTWHAGGRDFYVWQMWDPLRSGVGFWNWAGQVAWLMSLIITATSLEWARARAYELFRWSHYLFVPMMVLSAAHFSNTWWFFQLPMAFLAADWAYRWVLSARRGVPAHLVYLDPQTFLLRIKAGDSVRYAPGDMVQIRVPSIASMQWHAFTVADAADSGWATICIAATGWWSRQLLALCQPHGPATAAAAELSLVVDVEGPYAPGAGRLQRVVDGLRAGQRAVVFAGGTAVAEALSILHAADQSGAAAQLPNPVDHAGEGKGSVKLLHVVWLCRSPGLVAAVKPMLTRYTAAHVDVYVPAAAAEVKAGKDEGWGMAAKASPSPESLHKSSSDYEGAGDGSRNDGGATWVPFVLRVLVLYLALGCSVAFYWAGSVVCCTRWEWLAPLERMQADVDAYRAAVAERYLQDTGTALGPNEWPEGQAVLPIDMSELAEDTPHFMPMTCELAGQPDHYILGCDPTVESITPYGLPPTISCGNTVSDVGRCYACAVVTPIIFSIFGGVIAPILLAAFMRLLLRRVLNVNINGPAGNTARDPEAGSCTLVEHHERADLAQVVRSCVKIDGEQLLPTVHVAGSHAFQDAVVREVAHAALPVPVRQLTDQ